MASLTVRQLDDTLKRLLRLRAARHGRSMEDEIRVILKAAANEAAHQVPDDISPPTKTARQKTRTVTATGPLDPQFSFHNSNFWAQGVSLGVQLQF